MFIYDDEHMGNFTCFFFLSSDREHISHTNLNKCYMLQNTNVFDLKKKNNKKYKTTWDVSSTLTLYLWLHHASDMYQIKTSFQSHVRNHFNYNNKKKKNVWESTECLAKQFFFFCIYIFLSQSILRDNVLTQKNCSVVYKKKSYE